MIMKCALCGIESCDSIKLSPQQQQCLTYLAKGFTIEECTDLMGISRETIKSYRRTLYKKLDVGSIAEASAMAVRMGLPV
jgi:DNA-binding CsgD family transcriptional regulator